MMSTYTKLRDGSWGVRVPGSTTPGSLVTVAKKDGTTKLETIGRVLWAGDGVALCTITPSEARPQRCYTGKTYERGVGMTCDECGEHARPGTTCWETGRAH
jgi:hypothetical protein